MSNPSQPVSRRLKMTPDEADGSKFYMPHGRQYASKVQGQVGLGEFVPGMDEVPVPIQAGWLHLVMNAAVEHGCQHVADRMSPAECVPFVNALQDALAVEKDLKLKGAIETVMRVCRTGKGLRVC